MFAALLGEPRARPLAASRPRTRTPRSSRRYRGETGILETTFETAEGAVTIIDFMPLADSEDQVELIRLVRGVGPGRMHTEFVLRFDYGRGIPWVRAHLGGPDAVAGPNAVQFVSPVALRGTPELTTVGEFTVSAGECVPFTMSWYPRTPRLPLSRPHDPLVATENSWSDWSSRCTLQGQWREPRPLADHAADADLQPTGGIVAAATTSLPE